MPLSEHEQRLLDEMERSLYHSDHDSLGTVPGGRPAYRSIVIGVLLAVAGLCTIVAGVFIQVAVIGIVGFLVMLAGVILAITPSRSGANEKPGMAGKPTKAGAGQPRSFMDRLGDRWDRREDGMR